MKLLGIWLAAFVWITAGRAQSFECAASDCRDPFEAGVYLGVSVDSFAGSEALAYLNPGASGPLQERGVAGVTFEYRVFGSPESPRGRQLWVTGETVHGARSAEIDCHTHPGFPACQMQPAIPFNPLADAVFLLRNASSLEGSLGLRWEFRSVQPGTRSPANSYVKAQAGFMSVAGAGAGLKVAHSVSLGALVTNGDYRSSYLEAGWGRSTLFARNPSGRFRMDAYLSRGISPNLAAFAEMRVDTAGGGSGSVQSRIGLRWDLRAFAP